MGLKLEFWKLVSKCLDKASALPFLEPGLQMIVKLHFVKKSAQHCLTRVQSLGLTNVL